jgi:hypothetical protein
VLDEQAMPRNAMVAATSIRGGWLDNMILSLVRAFAFRYGDS